MISSAMSRLQNPLDCEGKDDQSFEEFFEKKFFQNTEFFDNTDDEFEPPPSKASSPARGAQPHPVSGDCDGGGAGATLSHIGFGKSIARGIPAEWGGEPVSREGGETGNRALARGPTGAAIDGGQPLHAMGLSAPPGTWILDGRSSAGCPKPATTTAALPMRLVKAVRQPPPLYHTKAEPVTSLTVNAIPCQMRRTQLCALLDETGFAGRYDYVYVPCGREKTNRGHAFVNFCSPDDARAFFAIWHGARVEGFGSHAPVLFVSVSVNQGFEVSVQRWTVAKMLSLSDPDFRPFIAGATL